jgi:hypothetical protein
LMNSHTVSLLYFKSIKACYHTKKKYNKKIYIIFLVLSSHSFRDLEGLIVS